MNLRQDFLSNHKHRIIVDSFLSFWEYILSGAPQDYILGPRSFNIFKCDKFLVMKTVYFIGYTNDNTSFVVARNMKDVIRSLEEVGENFIAWFSNNQMKLNPDKCHLLLNTKEKTILKIINLHIKNSLCKEFLSINFDYMLNFTKHTEDICQKASRKLNAFARLAPYMTSSKNVF